MKNKIDTFFFILANMVKMFFVVFLAGNHLIGIGYSLISFVVYFFIYKKWKNISSILPVVMIDYICLFYFSYVRNGLGLDTIIISIMAFFLANGFVLYLLANEIAISTSSRKLSYTSNDIVDEGIKALQNEDYDKALEAFSSAIKEYKKNYLGYMGMCTTLTKMDKKNIKKIKYYKKKCIKYAPRELKESISNKY